MGLYSTIKPNYKLPLPADTRELTAELLQSEVYQTKDLNEDMQHYEISELGELLERKVEGEWTEGNKKAKSILGRMGHFNITKEWLEPTKFTGKIVFYTSAREDTQKQDHWIEYKSVFVDGLLKSLELLKVESTDNTARKAQDAKWKAELAATYEFRKKWYMRFLYLPYQSAVRWVFRKYNQIKQKLPPSYKIERFLTPL